MKIDLILHKYWSNEIKTTKEAKSQLHSAVLKALPKKKQKSDDYTLDQLHAYGAYVDGFNSALDDVRKKMNELFELSD